MGLSQRVYYGAATTPAAMLQHQVMKIPHTCLDIQQNSPSTKFTSASQSLTNLTLTLKTSIILYRPDRSGEVALRLGVDVQNGLSTAHEMVALLGLLIMKQALGKTWHKT